MKPKPRYVVVEGIDGSGKSDLTVAIKKCIERRDGKCDAFKVPSFDGPIGKLIRNVFDGEIQIEDKAMMHLFAADAIDQERYLFERLLIGNDVVSDRHNAISSLVYQRPIPHALKTVFDVNSLHFFRRPNLLVWLDFEPTVAFEWLQKRMRDEPKTTDRKYKPTDLFQLELCRERYQLAMTVIGESKWALNQLTLTDHTLSTEDMAQEVCDRIGRPSTVHRATIQEARKISG